MISSIWAKNEKDKKPKKRNKIFINFENNLFGNNMPVEAVEYEVWVEFVTGSGWSMMYTGTTNSDGMITFVPHTSPDELNYKVVFLGDWSHEADLFWAGVDVVPTEHEFSGILISVEVNYDTGEDASAFLLEIYHWNGATYDLLATQTTSGTGITSFVVLEGMYSFTDMSYNDKTVVKDSASVSVVVEIPREFADISSELIYRAIIG